jgi:hypothetical protein
MISKRFRAWGLPLGPSIRMKFFAGHLARRLNSSKPIGRVDCVIAKDRLSRIEIAGEKGFDPSRSLHCFPESVGQPTSGGYADGVIIEAREVGIAGENLVGCC